MALVINGSAPGGNAYIGTSSYPAALYISDEAGGVMRQAYAPLFQVGYATDGNNQGAGVVTYGTVNLNVGSGYNTSTGRFTAPVAGYYYFWANVQAQATDSTSISAGNPYSSLLFQKNGSTYGCGEFVEVFNGGGEHKTPSGAIVVQLAVNDYITVYASRGCRRVQCGFCGFLIN